jgi:hypothetical protein
MPIPLRVCERLLFRLGEAWKERCRAPLPRQPPRIHEARERASRCGSPFLCWHPSRPADTWRQVQPAKVLEQLVAFAKSVRPNFVHFSKRIDLRCFAGADWSNLRPSNVTKTKIVEVWKRHPEKRKNFLRSGCEPCAKRLDSRRRNTPNLLNSPTSITKGLNAASGPICG